MTTYSAIASTELDADSPVTDTLMARLDGNPRGMAEMDATAVSAGVLMANAWQNHDGTAGLTAIYDFAIDGAVANVTTPDFEDGFEYRVIMDDLGSAGTGVTIQCDLLRETAGTYAGAVGLITTGGGVAFLGQGEITISTPRRSGSFHRFFGSIVNGTTNAVTASTVFDYTVIHTTGQKVLRARLTSTGGNITNGRVYLLRCGEYVSR